MDSKKEEEKMSMDLQGGRYSRSDNDRFLFVFVCRDDGRYLLYKLDALRLFRENLTEEKLLPLIIFKRGVLPNCKCAFAFIEPNFYIVGEEKHQVFTLNKYQLLKLDPSEKSRGGEFLTRINTPMLGKKLDPLAFAYNDNLYVICKAGSLHGPMDFSFEVYSTSNDTWTDLFPKPYWRPSIKSCVILESMVYFTMSNETVMSFNFKINKWSTVYDPYGVLYIHKEMFPQIYTTPPTTFDSQIQVFGNTIIGGVFRPGAKHYDIFASQLYKPFEDFFLRPTLPLCKDFCNALDSQTRDFVNYSQYIVNMGGGIMCLVCYGKLPLDDHLSSHAVLIFYKVSNEPHQSLSISSPAKEGDAMEEDGQHVNYFKADFVGCTHLPINTTKKFTQGTLCSCILV